jgi:hypothetical protein
VLVKGLDFSFRRLRDRFQGSVTRLYSGCTGFYSGFHGSHSGSYRGKIPCSLMTLDGVLRTRLQYDTRQ